MKSFVYQHLTVYSVPNKHGNKVTTSTKADHISESLNNVQVNDDD